MLVSALHGVALDYWTARALADVIEEVRFSEDGQVLVVATGERGELPDGDFSPSTLWASLGPVVERAERIEFTTFVPFTADADDGTVRCVARFTGANADSEGKGNSKRVALARCFIAARLGPEVDDDFPREPHRPRHVTPRIEPGTADDLPRIEETPDPNGAIGDIQSLPRQ